MDTPRSMLLDVCIHIIYIYIYIYIYIFVFMHRINADVRTLWSLQLVDMHSFRGAGYSPAASGNERGGHNISGVRRLMRVASERVGLCWACAKAWSAKHTMLHFIMRSEADTWALSGCILRYSVVAEVSALCQGTASSVRVRFGEEGRVTSISRACLCLQCLAPASKALNPLIEAHRRVSSSVWSHPEACRGN